MIWQEKFEKAYLVMGLLIAFSPLKFTKIFHSYNPVIRKMDVPKKNFPPS